MVLHIFGKWRKCRKEKEHILNLKEYFKGCAIELKQEQILLHGTVIFSVHIRSILRFSLVKINILNRMKKVPEYVLLE